MARTLNGNLTGRAARTERNDQQEYDRRRWVEKERQRMADYEDTLIDAAIELPGFREFWEMVPEHGSRRERIQMLEKFIEANKKQVRVP